MSASGPFNPVSADEAQTRQTVALEAITTQLGEIIDRLAPSVDAGGASRLSSLVADHDLKPGHDEYCHGLALVRFDVDPSIASAIHAIVDVTSQGGEVVVVTKPNLVAAVKELLDHDASHSSVSRDSEGSGAAGSTSSDSAAPSDNSHHREPLEWIAKQARRLAENSCDEPEAFINPTRERARYSMSLDLIAETVESLRRNLRAAP